MHLSSELEFFISVDDVKKAIKSLENKNTTGPDGLSELFIKQCSDTIIFPLLLLFNKSLESCIFPKIWKKSSIIPVFKSGNKQDIKNYRPIAIMGTVAKLFDSIMAEKLTERLILHIIKYQNGFVKNRSTLTNLLLYHDFISKCLDKYNQVDFVYLDFLLKRLIQSITHC